jgi:hypothetical protein
MSAYVDSLQNWGWRLGRSAHLIADTLDELHSVAQAIGLRRAWFQASPPATIDHYDLTEARRAVAIRMGCIELDRTAFVHKCRAIRAASRSTNKCHNIETVDAERSFQSD